MGFKLGAYVPQILNCQGHPYALAIPADNAY